MAGPVENSGSQWIPALEESKRKGEMEGQISFLLFEKFRRIQVKSMQIN
jgi:hypothetical protein